MQIVTDSGTDVFLSPAERADLNVHVIPLNVTLDGKTYREGLDIEAAAFYDLLGATESLPTTSLPTPGDFVELYRSLAAADPDILSIHISSGLSGTVGSARTAASMVPEANITVVDTLTLSAASGWQIEAAARAAKAGWPREKILILLQRISDATDILYTLKELKYLIHGGRISHMKGLLASMLNIKPYIGVDKTSGAYVQMGQARSFKRTIRSIVDHMAEQHGEGSDLRVQVLHAQNPEGAAMLREEIATRFNCTWLPTGRISLVLGAHTGPSLIGCAYAPAAVFADVP